MEMIARVPCLRTNTNVGTKRDFMISLMKWHSYSFPSNRMDAKQWRCLHGFDIRY